MKNCIILVVFLFSIISCKEQVSNISHDPTKIRTKTEYSYQHKNGQLKSQMEKIYFYRSGQIIDSIINSTNFIYNEKGLKTEELTFLAAEENPFIKTFKYNQDDSLISELYITPEQDTLTWQIFDFFPDGKKMVFFRFLNPKDDFFPTATESAKNVTYDTVFSRFIYEYENDGCKKRNEFDINGNLIKSVSFDYQNQQLKKESHYNHFDKILTREKVKVYDYSKSDSIPDWYSLNETNDTIEYSKSNFKAGSLLKTITMYENGEVWQEDIYEDNLLKLMTSEIRNVSSSKMYYLFDYYGNGDLKSTIIYSEDFDARE